MSDKNLHKDVLKARKERKREYMREYMRIRRGNPQKPQSSVFQLPRNLHGPVAPKNLPRADSPKAILKAHLNHALALLADTGKELTALIEANEKLGRGNALPKDMQHLQAEMERLLAERESLLAEKKDLQGKIKAKQAEAESLRETSKPSETCNLQPSTPSEPPKREVEPGFVDPDRRPTSAADPEASWMG